MSNEKVICPRCKAAVPTHRQVANGSCPQCGKVIVKEPRQKPPAANRETKPL